MSLKLTTLLKLVEELPVFRDISGNLSRQYKTIQLAILDAAKPYFMAALHQSLKIPMLVITVQPKGAKQLAQQFSSWLDPEVIRLFPEPDGLPYEPVISDSTTELERLQAFSALAGLKRDNLDKPASGVPLVVTCASALIRKIVPYHDFISAFHTIKVGAKIEPENLLDQWQKTGYKLESTVEVPGTMSRRGGIIDIYPPTSNLPTRLEFFGNTIDSIRLFDPQTQRSLEEATSVTISPSAEFLIPNLSQSSMNKILVDIGSSNLNHETEQRFKEGLAQILNKQSPDDVPFYAPLFNYDFLLSYLPSNSLVVLDEPDNLKNLVEDLDSEFSELRGEKIKKGELPSNFPRPYFTWQELEGKLGGIKCLTLASLADLDGDNHEPIFTPAPGYAGQLLPFIKKTREFLRNKHRVILISRQARRLEELFETEGIIVSTQAELNRIPETGSLTLLEGSLDEGWVLDKRTHLLSDREIFGFRKELRFSKKRPVKRRQLLLELAPGDYVVHVEHGIAKFAGVTTMRTSGAEKEYLALKYASGDKLYVPTDQIDRVSRYIGSTEQPPVLSRLGTQEWRRTRQKTKEAVEAVADELLNLYATREVLSGYAFSSDTTWQQELEEAFPYVETPDQIEVQRQIKEDMENTKPMDRLVCGDVGYGKTEVAIRAAFKTVMDNKQVAVLVPTTVLAQQHLSTFHQRLAAFPIRTEVLSRFKTSKELKSTLEGLKNGLVDICIGTHRLLQKDVIFKDLGLLIIDEEQRFGVAHKEYLKRMRQEVDVLTLSATPIPRTLQMSLAAIRDMSVMETPPEDRLPIKTYLAEYSDWLIREVILRELERNGQVFFVHNRVQSIAFVAGKLKSVVPEAEIVIAHGQMPEAELERVMARFIQGTTDVLVCSTIIESGLDMPNVNTLIVNQADKFGLTQLYQLRGRVGRGSNLAHAYFLYDKGKRLTQAAQKRLKTIAQATELGAGFNIAIKDLEIRGAGTMLGTRQSGHISAVGFNLYCQLLAEAVEELKARRAGRAPKPPKPPEPTIDLPLDTFIPTEYVSDLETRLTLYQNLAKLDQTEQVEAQAVEFEDRFGTLPTEVGNLLYAIKIKILAASAGVESVSTEEGQVILRLLEGLKFSQKQRELLFTSGVRVGSSQIRLNLKQLDGKWQETLEDVLKKIK